jgi:hypothetical protein
MNEQTPNMKTSTHRVALRGSTVHIGNLDVHLEAAAEYMRGIPADKLEAAFVHAVQVGMSEIVARRRRFQMEPRPAAPIVKAPLSSVPRAEAVTNVEDIGIQPRVTAPPAPRMEAAGEFSSEACPPVAKPHVEADGWLRRLDEDLEILDPVHALDRARTGR